MKISVHKVTAIGLALLLLGLPTLLSAKERRGANLVVTLKDGQNVSGELIAVKPDSLLLLNLVGKDESVDMVGIRSIRIVKKSKAMAGALCGFLVGWAGGAIALGEGEMLTVFLGGNLIGFAGALIGLGVGAGVGTDKTIRFEGMERRVSREDRARVLADLRRKARIRDYK